MVWWETLCWWDAWGPALLGPIKSGPAYVLIYRVGQNSKLLILSKYIFIYVNKTEKIGGM